MKMFDSDLHPSILVDPTESNNNTTEKFPAGGLKAHSVPRRTIVMNLENIL